MTKKFRSPRRRAVLLTLLLAIGAPLAYAYWTTTGSGSGSATTGTSQAVTITQTATVSNMYPGGPAQGLDFKINNPASGTQYVSTVSIAIASVTKATGVTGTCDASDYALTQPTTPINQDLPSGDTSFSGAKAGTLRMVNKGSTNQDPCKNATVNLTYSSN